jgi:hypothetical protein
VLVKTIHKDTYELLKTMSAAKELNSFALTGDAWFFRDKISKNEQFYSNQKPCLF